MQPLTIFRLKLQFTQDRILLEKRRKFSITPTLPQSHFMISHHSQWHPPEKHLQKSLAQYIVNFPRKDRMNPKTIRFIVNPDFTSEGNLR